MSVIATGSCFRVDTEFPSKDIADGRWTSCGLHTEVSCMSAQTPPSPAPSPSPSPSPASPPRLVSLSTQNKIYTQQSATGPTTFLRCTVANACRSSRPHTAATQEAVATDDHLSATSPQKMMLQSTLDAATSSMRRRRRREETTEDEDGEERTDALLLVYHTSDFTTSAIVDNPKVPRTIFMFVFVG